MSAESSPAEPKPSAGAAPALISVIFINMLGFGIVVPLLPFYAKSFDAPAWQIALIFSAYSLGAFFGEPFWGRLSDRIGRKPILIWTITGNCLCYLTLAFAPNVYVAFLIRLAGGLASGNGSVIQGYIADVTPPEQRARRMAWMGAAWNFGLIIGPSVGGLFAHPDAGPIGFQIPLFIASGMSLLCALSIVVFIRESRQRTQLSEQQGSRWAVIGDVVRNPIVSRLMLVSFLVGCAFTGIESTFALWAQQRFDWGPRDIGVCFAVVGVGAGITQMFVTGPLSERFGPGRMLAVGMGITLVCATLQPLSNHPWLTIGLMTLTAIGSSVAFPNIGAMISAAIDPDRQGQTLGLNNAAGAMARVIGPLCAGLAFAEITIHAPFLMGALIQIAALWIVVNANRAVARQARQA